MSKNCLCFLHLNGFKKIFLSLLIPYFNLISKKSRNLQNMKLFATNNRESKNNAEISVRLIKKVLYQIKNNEYCIFIIYNEIFNKHYIF